MNFNIDRADELVLILLREFNLEKYAHKGPDNNVVFESFDNDARRKYVIPLNIDIKYNPIKDKPEETFVNGLKQLRDELQESKVVQGMMRERDEEISELKKEVKELQSKVNDMTKYKNYYDVAMNLNHGEKK